MSERDESPVTLPRWVVDYLAKGAFTDEAIGAAITSGDWAPYEFEAAWIVAAALESRPQATGPEPTGGGL